jgi:hypothetical protein
MKRALAVLIAALALLSTSCVERRMTVISDPPGALVYLDDEEKGYTPVTFTFYFYGTRTFVLKRDGCRILEKVVEVERPWWEGPIIQVFTDLGPIPLTDKKTYTFKLEALTEHPVTPEEVIRRATEMKSRVEGMAPPAEEKPATPPAPKKPSPAPPLKKQADNTP